MNREAIYQRLMKYDSQALVEVMDLTGTMDHWEVEIESETFRGLTRIQQHKKIMDCFQQELASGEIHALSLRTKVKS